MSDASRFEYQIDVQTMISPIERRWTHAAKVGQLTRHNADGSLSRLALPGWETWGESYADAAKKARGRIDVWIIGQMSDRVPLAIAAHLVDGGLLDIVASPDFLTRLRQLRELGSERNELINRLITDDWRRPPSRIVVSGTAVDGQPLEIVIPYD